MTSSNTYHEWIRSLVCTGYIKLKFLDEKVMQKPEHIDATCTIIQLSPKGVLEKFGIPSEADFAKTAFGKSRRLFILEGISQTCVEKLGSALDIEPEFFAGHLRSVTWGRYDDRSDAVMLPSIQKQAKFWMLQYLDPDFRRVFISNPNKKDPKDFSVGLVSRFISVWQQHSDDGSFDAVLLADSPIKHTLHCEYDDVEIREPFTTTRLPYGASFVDFANLSSRRDFVQRSPEVPESRSMSLRESLLWRPKIADLFWTSQTTTTISSVDVVLQRTALSNWTPTLAFLRRDFNSINLSILTGEDQRTAR